jgi:trans-aconitate methyltransferase
MTLWSKLSSQFGKPTGPLGSLAGFIVAHRKSNIERTGWAIEALRLKADDHVLEIGFGPGVAIEKMSAIVTRGVIHGIDHSSTMLAQATKRNRNAVAAGRVTLCLASVSQLPSFENPIDKVLDINSFQFWPNQVDNLKSLRGCMARGGLISIVHQPRKPGATHDGTRMPGNASSSPCKRPGSTTVTWKQN